MVNIRAGGPAEKAGASKVRAEVAEDPAAFRVVCGPELYGEDADRAAQARGYSSARDEFSIQIFRHASRKRGFRRHKVAHWILGVIVFEDQTWSIGGLVEELHSTGTTVRRALDLLQQLGYLVPVDDQADGVRAFRLAIPSGPAGEGGVL